MSTQLSISQRWLLVIPLAAALVLGILAYFTPSLFAYLINYPGNYIYIYQLAGAATFGYAFPLYLAVSTGNLRATRFAILGAQIFNLAALYTVLSEFYRQRGNLAVEIVGIAALLNLLIVSQVLRTHKYQLPKGGNLSVWATRVLTLSVISAALFGISPLIPRVFIPLFGYGGVDAGILKIAGAATLGYAVMGFMELKSQLWEEVRWPLIMGLVFNALAFAASLVQLVHAQSNRLVWIVVVASGFFTVSFLSILFRKGK